MTRRQRRARKGEAVKIRSDGLMTPWTSDVKFPYGAQFLIGSLMFAIGEDGNLKLLPRGLAPSYCQPVYGKAPYYPADPSTSLALDNACSGLNPYVGSYYLSAMTSQGYPIGTPIFQPSVGTSSSSSLGASPDRDSIEEYPKIGGNICQNPAVETHRINMVGPARAPSHNSSSRYPTIRGSKASDAQIPSNRVIRNMNPDFNAIQL
jgi:hypothetical protein